MDSKDLSFCKFRIPVDGGRVIWEVTNACNYACSYCIFSSTGRKAENELTLEKIKSTLLELKKMNFTHIKYTGGEPFLRDDMIEILQYTKSLGLDCDVSSNASFFTEKIVDDLSKLNLEMLHISLDGYDKQSHEIVRGKKTFEPTINGIKLLNDKNIFVRVGCVIHEYNESNLEDVVKLCVSLNVNEVIFSLMEPVGRMKDSSKFLAKKNVIELSNEIKRLQKLYSIKISSNLPKSESIVILKNTIHSNEKNNKNSICPGGEKFLFINSGGDVSPCTWITEKAPQFVLGSLYRHELNEILNNEKAKSFFDSVSSYKNICPADSIKNVQSVKFSNNSKIYAFTTENLEYLKNIEIKDKKVLTVGGSLDQNLVCELLEAKSVVNVDLNNNAYYYAQLKWNAIKVLSFKEFVDFFMRGTNAFSLRIYRKVQPLLNKDCDLYFQSLFNTYKKGHYIREGYLFNNINDEKLEKIFNSYYLRDENSFLKVKNNIKDKDLNWIEDNIINFKTNEKFDVILLSNIADYSHKMFLKENHIELFKQYIVDNFKSMLCPNGILMFAYIFDYQNKNGSDKRNIINNLKVRKDLYSNDHGFKYDEIVLKSAIKGDFLDSACIISKM